MFSATEHEQTAQELERLAATCFSGAVAIVDGSQTEFLRTFGFLASDCQTPTQNATLFDIGSVTKTFTAAAIVRLESTGLLPVDQTLDQFFGSLPPSLCQIRLHHLLTHSSGLADFLGPSAEPREYSVDEDYQPLSREELLDRIFRSRLLFPPGERWSYSNAGYSLLAAIVELTAGDGFEAYLRQALLRPLAMHDTGYTFGTSEHSRVASGRIGDSDWGRPVDKAESPSWNLLGNGGLLTSIADLVRWQAAFCQLADDMLCGAANRRIVVEPDLDIWCGRGVFLCDTGSNLGPVAYHNGTNLAFSATVRWFPALNRFLAVVGNQLDHSALEVARTLSDCWKASQPT